MLTASHVYIAGPVSLVAGNPCINSYSDDVSEVSTTTMLLETFRNYSVEFDLNAARFLGWQWGVVGLCVLLLVDFESLTCVNWTHFVVPFS